MSDQKETEKESPQSALTSLSHLSELAKMCFELYEMDWEQRMEGSPKLDASLIPTGREEPALKTPLFRVYLSWAHLRMRLHHQRNWNSLRLGVWPYVAS
jgi:hypothetical protein